MRVYLDNNASTAPDPAVIDAIARAMADLPGNSSSAHFAGRSADAAIENARETLGALLDCRAGSLVFTSGATEANNLALVGLWEAQVGSARRRRIVVSASEHPAILETAHHLAAQGAEVVTVPVTGAGAIDLAYLDAVVNEDTLVVSVMAANNETGVINPLAEVVRIAHSVGALAHTDATQAIGRIPVSINDLDIDLLSLSSHKMYGPKGVGALYVSRGIHVEPVLRGGGHERGFRSGTLSTYDIVGFGVAALLASQRLGEAERIAHLRDNFVTSAMKAIKGVTLNGLDSPRLPNTANLWFDGADAEAVMAGMPDIACSSGSACTAATQTPSHVLIAMGMSVQAASECLRFSLGRSTTENELAYAVQQLAESVEHVRHLSTMSNA